MRFLSAVIVCAFVGSVAMAGDVPPAQQSPDSATAAAAPATAAPTQASSSSPAPTAAPATSVSTAAQPSQSVPAAAPQAAPNGDGTSSSQVKVQMVNVPSTFKVPAGYKAVTRGSTTVYCRTSKTTGSNIPQTTCMSEQQLTQLQRQEEEARREIAQKSGTCVGACGGG